MKYRISTTAGLTTTLLAALFIGSPVRAADQEPIFMYSVCYKAQPGKRAELQEFLAETAPKLAKARIAESNQIAWGASASVIPIGETAECDFITSRTYLGAPSDLALGSESARAKAGIDPEKSSAQFRSSARVINSALWRVVDGFGEIAVGDYFKVDRMLADPVADWAAIETRIFKPVHEARAKGGPIKAWFAYAMVSPSGDDLNYNAATVNVLDGLDKLGATPGYEKAFEQTHPDLRVDWVMEKTQNTRTIVRSTVHRAIAQVREQ